MSVIRVAFTRGFKGEAVVLLAMDGDGVAALAATLTEADRHGSSHLQHNGVAHEFVIEAGRADVELDDSRVVWRLDRAKTAEIGTVLEGLGTHEGPAHQYVDISQPTDTLVVSRDEYFPAS